MGWILVPILQNLEQLINRIDLIILKFESPHWIQRLLLMQQLTLLEQELLY